MLYHLDTDVLVVALSRAGPERARLLELSDIAELQVSAIVWFEFSRGPRTPEQLAVARAFFGEDSILPFTEIVAARASEVYRRLGSPRRRAADIAIGVTATESGAVLVTRNRRDFAGIPELQLDWVT